MKVFKINGYRWVIEYRGRKGHAFLGGKKEFEFDMPATLHHFISLIPERYKDSSPDLKFEL
jgi:hypothetical protein